MTAPLWWLSFSDPDRQEGDRFLGGCVVAAYDLVGACRAAWALECNPGGEMRGEKIPAENAAMIKRSDVGRLMDLAACRVFSQRFAS